MSAAILPREAGRRAVRGRPNWPLLVVAVAAAQWLVFGALALASRSKLPKAGLRTSDRNLVVSSVVLALCWLTAFVPLPARFGSKTAARPSGGQSVSSSKAGCWMIDLGTSADRVKSSLGAPDEIRNDEEARGPGAVTWVYRDARCAVDIFDGKVEAIE